jgi:N-succinyl-L-ornithine transcarbamylase
MALTNNAKFMHCLPVRRNVIVTDEVLDSENSIVIEQANNRTYAAQLVLQKYLKMHNKKIDYRSENWWKHN